MSPVAYILGAAVLALAVDQASKLAVVRHGDHGPSAGAPGRSRRLTVNRGDGPLAIPAAVAAALWVVVTAAGLSLVAASPHEAHTTMTLGAGMAIGGSASNLLDRMARGGVIDFISLGRWPSFNPADVALTAAPALVAAGIAWPG